MRREILIQTIDPPSNVVGTLTSDEEPYMLHLARYCLFLPRLDQRRKTFPQNSISKHRPRHRVAVIRFPFLSHQFLLLRDGIGPAEQPTGDLPMTSKKIA
jgi:hypothetical protein